MAAMVILCSSPAISSPGVYWTGYQSAEAQWAVKQGGQLWVYFARGFRGVHLFYGTKTFASVGRVRCRSVNAHGEVKGCNPSGSSIEIPPHDFMINPIQGTARLTLSHKGSIHEIEWSEAAGEAEVIHDVQHTPEGRVILEGGVDRRTLAEGQVLGKTLTKGRLVSATVYEGAVVQIHTDDRYDLDPNGRPDIDGG